MAKTDFLVREHILEDKLYVSENRGFSKGTHSRRPQRCGIATGIERGKIAKPARTKFVPLGSTQETMGRS